MADTPSDSDSKPKQSIGSMVAGATVKTFGVAATVGAGALLHDALRNDGEGAKQALGDNRFTQELGRVGDNVGGALSNFFNKVVIPAKDGLWSAMQHPAGNPWFQGLAALFVGILAWKGVSMYSASQDSTLGKFLSGGAGLILVPAIAMGAAAFMGMARDDGPAPAPQSTVSADRNPSSQQAAMTPDQ